MNAWTKANQHTAEAKAHIANINNNEQLSTDLKLSIKESANTAEVIHKLTASVEKTGSELKVLMDEVDYSIDHSCYSDVRGRT